MPDNDYKLLHNNSIDNDQHANHWFNFSLNTRYTLTSVLFNIAAVLMVQTSESDNGLPNAITDDEIFGTRIIILIATLWPLYHATHGWETTPVNMDDSKINTDEDENQSAWYQHAYPKRWFVLSYLCSMANLYNSFIIGTDHEESDLKTAIFWLLLAGDFSTTVASDIYLRRMYHSANDGINQHFINDPTILLRLWKSCSGALKQAFFGNGSDSNTIVLWTTVIDSFGFALTYYSYNAKAQKIGKSVIQSPNLSNAIPLVFLVAAIVYVISVLPNKNTSLNEYAGEHLLAIGALTALLIESTTVAFMHPGRVTDDVKEELDSSLFRRRTQTSDEENQSARLSGSYVPPNCF